MLLEGKKGLVLNVVNKHSIGWAIAEVAAKHGAKIGVGAQNERNLEAVQKLTAGQASYQPLVVDFSNDHELEALVESVQKNYGKIDFLVHSAAFAPREELENPFIQTSREGFRIALDVSCYSLITLCKHLEPLFNENASVITLSYLGSTRALENYKVMGVAKAALESTVRYLSIDLGRNGVRINTLSPGPLNTVAARGVKNLSTMISHVQEKAPLKYAFTQEDVGNTAAYLISDLSRGVTGQVIYIDSGYNIMGI